ncbi:tetratricopeptide repeat protein [Sphingomonas sp. MMS24-JH45]
MDRRISGSPTSSPSLGDDAAARREYDKARILDPGSHVIEIEQACSHWQAGRDALALRQLNDLARRYPDAATVQNCLAWLHLSHNRLSAYADALKRQAEIKGDPASLDFANRLGSAARRDPRAAGQLLIDHDRSGVASGSHWLRDVGFPYLLVARRSRVADRLPDRRRPARRTLDDRSADPPNRPALDRRCRGAAAARACCGPAPIAGHGLTQRPITLMQQFATSSSAAGSARLRTGRRGDGDVRSARHRGVRSGPKARRASGRTQEPSRETTMLATSRLVPAFTLAAPPLAADVSAPAADLLLSPFLRGPVAQPGDDASDWWLPGTARDCASSSATAALRWRCASVASPPCHGSR